MSVRVISLFSITCFLKNGITEPLEFITFPYLTVLRIIFFSPTILFADEINLSATNFVAPYKLIGEAALSVDRDITFSTLLWIAALIIFSVPIIFVLINSPGLY
jgi:hypothetical protein